MARHRVTLIPGDGIGPEIAEVTLEVIAAAGVDIEWITRPAGAGALETYGSPLPPETLESIRETGLVLKGPLTTPIGTGFRSVNVTIRQEFDLYANVRPTRVWEGLPTHWPGMDLVIVRENTEGLYSGIEHYIGRDRFAAEAIVVVTRPAMERICRFAFELARKTGRTKVTAVHKANILKYTSGLFLETAEAVAPDYPDITLSERIIDNMCLQLVRDPRQFEIIVTTNMFGDILSDLVAGLAGGLGLAPSGNIGEGCAMFEAVHGSAPDIAGKGLANPSALILSACLMLDHVGETAAANRIREAIGDCYRTGDRLTGDLAAGKAAGTREFGAAVMERLSRGAAGRSAG
jgi:isocitrate dehydrogenase (NAD+)